MAAARLALRGLTLSPAEGAYHPLRLDTSAGEIRARYYVPETPRGAVLWLDDGVPDGAIAALYARTAEDFAARGVASLWPSYRRAMPAECVLDALVCVQALVEQALQPIVVVGHGLGALGAVEAAAQFPVVNGLAWISPDAAAESALARLAFRPMLLRLESVSAAPALTEWLTTMLPVTH